MTKTNVARKEPETFEYAGMQLTADEYNAVKKGHMVPMESLQTRRIANTSGHCKTIQARTPTLMPRALVKDAMAVGCVPLEAKDVEIVEAFERTKQDFSPSLRKTIILMAMEELYKANNSDHFTGAGQPRAEVLNDMVGFDVSVKERQTLWQELNSIIKEGSTIPPHENADVVYKIINAESREELLLIADEMGFDKEKLSGMVNKDLRYMMLKTYSQ